MTPVSGVVGDPVEHVGPGLGRRVGVRALAGVVEERVAGPGADAGFPGVRT
jgi:hypothetical protein